MFHSYVLNCSHRMSQQVQGIQPKQQVNIVSLWLLHHLGRYLHHLAELHEVIVVQIAASAYAVNL